jgi:CubicO group peptidase (beta-lactamase class C family)
VRRSVSSLVVLALGLCGWLSAVPRADRQRASTEWLAAPPQAARIARVESSIPPVEIANEAPIRLDLKGWMDTYRIPGLSVAVFDAFEIVWARSYGVKQAGSVEPVTIDTLFQAGSISKPVAAMAALHYVEAGKWTLDENINDKLISWKVPDNPLTKEQPVTLRRLLSHSAGTTVHGFPGYAVGEPVPTLVQLLDGEKPANTAPVRVDIVPGSKMRYSGGGTTIVQLMMVDQLKKPFPQIMVETVFQPLGLTHSTYEQPLPPGRAAMAASGARASGKTVEGKWHIYPEMAAAGLWTTPSDLARVAIEVAKSKAGTSTRVLSQAMTKQMLTMQAERAGLGFFLDAGTDRFGHNGADEGFQAYLIAFADSGSGAVVMANSDNGFMVFERIVASIAAEYGWKSFTASPDPIFVKVGLLAKVKGVDHAVAWYRSMQRQGPASTYDPRQLNSVGYQLLREGRVPDAVKVFEANVAIYPDDANAYDSLGEGYMEAGNTDAAIRNYRKSLQLDPRNANAVKMLEKLGAPWTPDAKQPE